MRLLVLERRAALLSVLQSWPAMVPMNSGVCVGGGGGGKTRGEKRSEAGDIDRTNQELGWIWTLGHVSLSLPGGSHKLAHCPASQDISPLPAPLEEGKEHAGSVPDTTLPSQTYGQGHISFAETLRKCNRIKEGQKRESPYLINKQFYLKPILVNYDAKKKHR